MQASGGCVIFFCADACGFSFDRPRMHLLFALEVKEAWGDHLAQTFFASTVVEED
jgi:hypothetical protein